jgi:hypothetical protein
MKICLNCGKCIGSGSYCEDCKKKMVQKKKTKSMKLTYWIDDIDFKEMKRDKYEHFRLLFSREEIFKNKKDLIDHNKRNPENYQKPFHEVTIEIK